MSGKLITNKRIAIIGGGPGGLILARLLQMNGADVKVYERDVNEHVRVKGATLNINEDSGLKAIHEAQLMEAFKKHYRPGAERLVLADHLGNILQEDEPDPEDGRREDRPEIDRGPLRNLLLESLQPNTVYWDHQFVSLQQIENYIALAFKNGKSAEADLVIAADGANSKIRPYITNIKPVYSGITLIEGTIEDTASAMPALYKLLNGGKICVVGDRKSMFVIQKGDGTAAFYTARQEEENWLVNNGLDFSDHAQIINWYKKEFSSWGETWHELFEKSTAFVPRPQYYLPFDQTWETLPNLTMIGDAAHVMPPYAGEGVNMAMQDALELTKALLNDDFSDIRTAIGAYEKEMQMRTAEAAKITMSYTEQFHAIDAIENLVNMFKHEE